MPSRGDSGANAPPTGLSRSARAVALALRLGRYAPCRLRVLGRYAPDRTCLHDLLKQVSSAPLAGGSGRPVRTERATASADAPEGQGLRPLALLVLIAEAVARSLRSGAGFAPINSRPPEINPRLKRGTLRFNFWLAA